MTESSIKDYLVAQAALRGFLAVKLAPTGSNGWPDWLVLGPYGVHGFIELKRPGLAPTSLQLHRIEELQRLDHLAEWHDSLGGVKGFLDKLQGFAVAASVSGADADLEWIRAGGGQ